MVRRGRKYGYAVLLLLLLSPTLYFAGGYAAALTANPTRTNQYIIYSNDGNWTATVTLAYPTYLVTGQRFPVSLRVDLQFVQPYIALYVGLAGVELRLPTAANSTTNVVQGWSTLSSNYTLLAKNYTSPGQFRKTLTLVASYPLNNTVTDILVPDRTVAINGIANVTAYSMQGDSASTSNLFVSPLDYQTIYLTQLSGVKSSTSWFFYQLLAIVLTSVIYARIGGRLVERADTAYISRLEAFRLQKMVEKLEELHKSDVVGDAKYNELKQRYERKLEELRRRTHDLSR